MSAPGNPAPGAAGPVPPRLDDPFVRFDGRLLDPATAVRRVDEPIPAATAYVGDRLMITAKNAAEAQELLARLEAVAEPLDLALSGPSPLVEIQRGDTTAVDVAQHNRQARLLQLADQAGIPLVFAAPLRVTAAVPLPAIDVWPLLQRLRAAGETAFALDHLLFPAVTIGGNPVVPHGTSVGGIANLLGTAFIGGNPVVPHGTSLGGLGSYVMPGSGGRAPVSVVMEPPARTSACRPVVVVLDTGCGQHPWFAGDPVTIDLKVSTGDSVGLDPTDPAVSATDPEGWGSVPDLMTGLLATHAGHGTFIAGLLRQRCPDALIYGLRLMDADGVVPTDRLTASLTALLLWMLENGDVSRVDAVVLSLGYYPETPDDANYSTGLLSLLVELADRGVVTFAAAGNDASAARYYPAAFADSPVLPYQGSVVAVRALNPDGSVALFSNDGGWVRGEAAGANVVSTTPVLMDGGMQAEVTTTDAAGRRRSTIDPDAYSSGFAIWSGTSFAAPVLAGEYLAELAAAGCPAEAKERQAILASTLRRP